MSLTMVLLLKLHLNQMLKVTMTPKPILQKRALMGLFTLCISLTLMPTNHDDFLKTELNGISVKYLKSGETIVFLEYNDVTDKKKPNMTIIL